jgi:hypothetical protein
MKSIKIDDLPFLAGKNRFIERLAIEHERRAVMLEEFTGEDAPFRPTWWQLLDAGMRAYESAAKEVSEATTADQASTATGRFEMVARGLHELEEGVLSEGKDKLARGMEEVEGHFSGYVAFGRINIDSNLAFIPPRHWEGGKVDWDECRLEVFGGPTWVGVRILASSDVEPEVIAQIIQEADTIATDPADLIRTGAPGRPTPMHLVEQEFRRRTEAGAVEDRVTRESEVLAIWLQNEHPSLPKLSAKAIRNKISPEYRRGRMTTDS